MFGSINIDRDNPSYTTTIDGELYKLRWRADTKRYQLYKNDNLIPNKSSGFAFIEKLKNEFNKKKHDNKSRNTVPKIAEKYEAIKPKINSRLYVNINIGNYHQPGIYMKKMLMIIK